MPICNYIAINSWKWKTIDFSITLNFPNNFGENWMYSKIARVFCSLFIDSEMKKIYKNLPLWAWSAGGFHFK